MKWLRARLHPDTRGDEGFAMVMVLGFTGVLTALLAVGLTMGSNALQSSRAHVEFESALAVAEAGIDATLATVSAAYNGFPSVDYATPGSCALTAPSTFTSDEQERTWARDSMVGLPDSCLTTAGGGQYIAVRPTNRRAVYAMSWFPSRAAENPERRLVKAEYLFAPYKPGNAVLTDGDLDFSGSVAVLALNVNSPADVHTNDDITAYNNSLTVQGAISASGTLPGSCPSNVQGGCSAAQPVQTLPTISARSYYNAQAQSNLGSWFDLCPDGTVRSPSTAPCLGTVLGASGYNGWEFTAGSGSDAPLWTLPRTAGGPYNGTYYVYRGDAQVGSNGNSEATWQISVLAEAETGVANADTCDKRGGNIDWKLFNLVPRLPGLVFLADANLTGDANSTAGSGLFLAGDKVDLQTSSASITGAVIAANTCAAQGANTIQGMTINYDDTLESPLTDVIRTALWLDYAAG